MIDFEKLESIIVEIQIMNRFSNIIDDQNTTKRKVYIYTTLFLKILALKFDGDK